MDGVAKARVSAGVVRSRIDTSTLFGVVAKRTYHVVAGVCRPADEQLALVEEPRIDDAQGRLLAEMDLIITRESTDLVVLGSARVNAPQRSFVASLRVGAFQREIQVTGKRRVSLLHDGRVAFSDPAPISEVPLTWDHAYGGVDHVGLEEIGDPFAKISAEGGAPMRPNQTLFAYPRNPFGKGYVIEGSARALEACELPTLEYARSPLTPEALVRGHFVHWPLAPIPAATEWLTYNVFPRSVQLGLDAPLWDEANVPPEQFHEVQAGVLTPGSLDARAPLAQRMNPSGASQASAPGMRTAHVAADASFQLTHMHPGMRDWSFVLPNETPRMAYRLPNHKPHELVPRIRQVVIEPDLDRVSVLWVGAHPLEVPATPREMEQLEHGVTWK